MNINEYLRLANELISDDERLKISDIVNELTSALSNLANNPAEVSFQQSLVAAEKRLKSQFIKMENEFYPGTAYLLPQISAQRWFTIDFYNEIIQIINANPYAPAVSRDHVNNIVSMRQTYLSDLKRTANGLESIGVLSSDVLPGNAIAKFSLPRSLFSNDLKLFEKEIKFITQFIDLINEISTGEVHEIQLHSLSTSDPSIVLHVGLEAAMQLGKLMTWSVALWGGVAHIRKVKADTDSLNAETAEKIAKLLENDITVQIENSLKDKVAELLGVKPQGRKAELKTLAERLLKRFLERTERGMQLSVEASALPKVDDGSETETNEKIKAINELAPRMPDRIVMDNPVLQISYDGNGEAQG